MAKYQDKYFSTELSRVLLEQIDQGKSIRGIARDAGVSGGTIRRALAGQPLDPGSLDRIADYLRLPPLDVYRMAGVLEAQNGDLPVRYRQMMYIFQQLPEKDQEELLEFALIKLRRT